MSANDKQVGGQHYRTSAVQHWDLCAARQYDYFQGQITKYIDRWKTKGGLDDLLKAQHFLQKYIEVHELYLPKEKGTGHIIAHRFIYIGYQNGTEIIECRYCHETMTGTNIDDMQALHLGMCGAEPTSAYTNQG